MVDLLAFAVMNGEMVGERRWNLWLRRTTCEWPSSARRNTVQANPMTAGHARIDK